ncbi:MAG: excisionase [Pseudomonadota bacterium]
MEPLGIKPSDAFAAIGCGKTKGWELIGDGELETFKIGSATRVTTESVRAYVERQVNKQREAA